MSASANSIPTSATPAVRRALSDAVARMETAGVPSAALAAEILLLHALGRDRTWLYTHPELALTAGEESAYAELIKRRAAGTPVQHLTGRQEFWGLEFEVTPDVLIPRPETEHIIEVAMERLRAIERRDDPLRIADVGTGSGCLAVTLAREFPRARVVATDVSAPALEVARRNAARHAVAARIEFLQMNLLDAYLADTAATRAAFDLIVSNPPYIALDEAAGLAREVRDHEPHAALFGGSTGVALYPALVAQAQSLLRPGATLVLELGHNSAELVCPLFERGDWSAVAITNDLAGIPRVLAADRV